MTPRRRAEDARSTPPDAVEEPLEAASLSTGDDLDHTVVVDRAEGDDERTILVDREPAADEDHTVLIERVDDGDDEGDADRTVIVDRVDTHDDDERTVVVGSADDLDETVIIGVDDSDDRTVVIPTDSSREPSDPSSTSGTVVKGRRGRRRGLAPVPIDPVALPSAIEAEGPGAVISYPARNELEMPAIPEFSLVPPDGAPPRGPVPSVVRRSRVTAWVVLGAWIAAVALAAATLVWGVAQLVDLLW